MGAPSPEDTGARGPTSRRSAVTGSFAAGERTGTGLVRAVASGATAGAIAGTVSNESPSTRPDP
ncbi:MAG: hypothetical protein KGI93_08850, partial [Acidobacteriota bacterium]|nr:hypothetical protein [Acidobacteriota bacterium]